MCGICGKISFGSTVNEGLIRKMCDTLRHRGPDDEGVYIGQSTVHGPRSTVALGHRRLSIIDLSQAGHQPMSNEDQSIWIVFNGEIYNFPELRENLIKKGHRFKSRTDAETVLHLYEDKGIDCIKDLRGMFAFALWDERKGKLFLVRDRLGQKPLFYSVRNGSLTFASELKALLEDESISKDIDFGSIDDFLNYKYIPAPFTIFRGVNKLLPAHFLVWEKGEVKTERYWGLDYSKKLKLDEDEYCRRISDLLRESTKIRLISDVPLGAFLSGGIDSSAIVGVMAGLMDWPVKTFSIGFEEETFDETPYARIVAEKFSTEHKEFVVKADALAILPELITHFGEPYGDSSAIPTYYLAKMTREFVTVALNGDAGDESFGGYERYVANRMAERYRLPLSVVGKAARNLIKNIPESTQHKDMANRMKRFLNSVALGREERYADFVSVFKRDDRAGIYSNFASEEIKKINRENIVRQEYGRSNTCDVIDSTLFVDLMTYMPGDLLPKVDITSMAHSLEARSPFLDHKFLEFSAGIPPHLKVKGLTTKYILKKALKDTLPKQIVNRKKAGFGVPVAKWFKDELKDYVYDILMSDTCNKRGYFNRSHIKQILDLHSGGKINYGDSIWCLLNLELWHRAFIDKEIT